MQVCKPDALCKKINNPVNYAIIKYRLHLERKEWIEQQKAKEEAKERRAKEKQAREERKRQRQAKKKEKEQMDEPVPGVQETKELVLQEPGATR